MDSRGEGKFSTYGIYSYNRKLLFHSSRALMGKFYLLQKEHAFYIIHSMNGGNKVDILHIDANSAYLSWTAVDLLKTKASLISLSLKTNSFIRYSHQVQIYDYIDSATDIFKYQMHTF